MYIFIYRNHSLSPPCHENVFIGLSRLGAERRLQEMEEMLTKSTEMLGVVTQEFCDFYGCGFFSH